MPIAAAQTASAKRLPRLRQQRQSVNPAMRFERDKTLRFQHCDPAGIIFYPQYFVLFHELMEEWFTEALNIPYGEYIRVQRLGVPAVKVEAEFLTQAFLGDTLRFGLICELLGASSLTLAVDVHSGDACRARGKITVVQMSLESRRAVVFDSALRGRIERFLPASS